MASQELVVVNRAVGLVDAVRAVGAAVVRQAARDGEARAGEDDGGGGEVPVPWWRGQEEFLERGDGAGEGAGCGGDGGGRREEVGVGDAHEGFAYLGCHFG